MFSNSGFYAEAARFERAPQGNIANLALFQKFTDFIDYFEPIAMRFPRHEQNVLCANIRNCMYRIMELMIVTNASKNRVAGWHYIDVQLEVLRTYVRRSRAKGSKYLSKRSHETAVKKLSEVGRILGGLINKTKG
jgi:hypothetical protein